MKKTQGLPEIFGPNWSEAEGPYDYLIAAQAIRHNCALITANEKEFSRVAGLRWENWTT
jgi:predicted nucleic acid-binding protein